MSSDNQRMIRNFAVIGKASASISPLQVSVSAVIGTGIEREGDQCTEVRMDSWYEPDTLPSILVNRLTRALVNDEDDVLICYQSDDTHMWISRLPEHGFTVSALSDPETRRQMAVCVGTGQDLSRTDWFSSIHTEDESFLGVCSSGCAALEHWIAETDGIRHLFSMAVRRPDKMWELTGGGLFAYKGGDEYEYEYLVIRLQNLDIIRLTETLIRISREMEFSLYDAGEVNELDTTDLLTIAESPIKYDEWYPIPDHWQRIVPGGE